MKAKMQLQNGMWVKITKSRKNWNSEMDKYDGMVVQVTDTIDNNVIIFNGSDAWGFVYSDGHFEIITYSDVLPIPQFVTVVRSWHPVWIEGKTYKVAEQQEAYPRRLSVINDNDGNKTYNVSYWIASQNENNTGFIPIYSHKQQVDVISPAQKVENTLPDIDTCIVIGTPVKKQSSLLII